jgi:hypothetical protein
LLFSHTDDLPICISQLLALRVATQKPLPADLFSEMGGMGGGGVQQPQSMGMPQQAFQQPQGMSLPPQQQSMHPQQQGMQPPLGGMPQQQPQLGGNPFSTQQSGMPPQQQQMPQQFAVPYAAQQGAYPGMQQMPPQQQFGGFQGPQPQQHVPPQYMQQGMNARHPTQIPSFLLRTGNSFKFALQVECSSLRWEECHLSSSNLAIS